jgi:hypothetical protein
VGERESLTEREGEYENSMRKRNWMRERLEAI